MGGAQARRLCPQAIVVRPRMSAYSEASKAVFEVFEDTTPAGRGAVDRRGVPRRARAASGSRARRRRSPARCGARCSSEVGLPITVGVARTKFLAKVASGVAKPDGLLVVPPDGELDFLHPLPVERLWGVGAVTAREAPRARHHDGRPGRRARRGRRWSRLLGRASGPAPPRARPQPRPAAGAGRAAAGARSARSARSGARPKSPHGSSTPVLVGLVDRLSRRLRAARPRRPHGRAAAALRRLLARHPLAHARRGRPRTRRRSSPTARGLLAAAMPLIERQGITLVGIALGNLDDDERGPARAAARPRSRARSTPRSTRCATASARAPITRAVLLGRDPGIAVPLLPD